MATKQAVSMTLRPPVTKPASIWERVRARVGIRRQRSNPWDSYLPHSYFTDGVNLYRLAGWVDRSLNAVFAELEDCRSLDIVLVSVEDLTRSVLRPVPITNAV